MALDRLGTSLKDALKKLAGKTVVDRAAVEELVKDLQRALIQDGRPARRTARPSAPGCLAGQTG